MSSNRSLSELEALKKRLELECRMVQLELQLLNANQEINHLRASQTPTTSIGETSGSSYVRNEARPIMVKDESESEIEENAVIRSPRALKRLTTSKPDPEEDDNLNAAFLTLHTRKQMRVEHQKGGEQKQTQPNLQRIQVPPQPNNSGGGEQRRFVRSSALSLSNIEESGNVNMSSGLKPTAAAINVEQARGKNCISQVAEISAKPKLFRSIGPLSTQQAISKSTGLSPVSGKIRNLAAPTSPATAQTAQYAARPNPFLNSISPPPQIQVRTQKRKSSTSVQCGEERPVIRQKLQYSQASREISAAEQKRLKQSDSVDVEDSGSNPSHKSSQGHSSSLDDIDHQTRFRSLGTPSLLAEAGDIDTNVPRAQRQRRIPQGGYQIPEYRRMTPPERHHLELRYCAHIVKMIQHKPCIRKPPLPLSQENLIDRCRRRFPDAVLACISTTTNSFLPSSQATPLLTKVANNSLGEPLYRTATDFLDHLKAMLHEYVRMGPCDNCPFAREGGKQSARVMCWRMRLESVVDEKMRGLKACIRHCDEFAGDLEGRKGVVDEWFQGDAGRDLDED